MKIRDLVNEASGRSVNLNCSLRTVAEGSKLKLNIIALGDVGRNLLLGLKLLGGDCIEEIGIYDSDEPKCKWLEREMGQICGPENHPMPMVRAIEEEELFNCHALIFCASKGVPPIGAVGDMRMAQLEGNKEIIMGLGKRISEQGFSGTVFVVSDPVDNLCNALLASSGLPHGNIRGCGLGVMDARAKYYADRDARFKEYKERGRVFGPHGEGLEVVNDIEDYDEAASLELAKLVKNANMEIRDLGFKPYIGPALSSGALSILGAIRGSWNYGSVYVGTDKEGSFFGTRSRLGKEGWEIEDVEIPEPAFLRIKEVYMRLCER